MLFVHSPEEAQRAKRRDFLIHFILFLFLFSYFKVPTLSYLLVISLHVRRLVCISGTVYLFCTVRNGMCI